MNKLIKINLNQTISKAQLEHLKEEKRKWLMFSLICLLFLGYLGWFGFINNRMDLIIESRKDTIEKIIKSTEQLKKEGKINLSKSDIKILNKLENKRMFWAPKLIALSEITPDRMSITGFEYDHKRLKISAISSVDKTQKDFDIVEDFMRRISENEEFNNDFKDIKFESMEKSNAKGNDVLSFAIEARLK